MKMKLVLFFFIPFYFCSLIASAITLKGHIFDSITYEKISSVTIYEVNNKVGIITNEEGCFELKLKKTNLLLIEISHLNYNKAIYKLNISKDTTVDFKLIKKDIQLKDVVVSATSKSKIENSSFTRIDNKQLNNAPALGGEKDILKALQFTPGVQPSNEGSIGLNVRGGSEDQNLYLIDNMPIYSPSHLFGFLSTFNADIISSTELVRAGLPANYGGKLSSLIDIRTKKPSYNNFNGIFSLGVVSSKIYTEIPILKNKSGLLLSFRTSYLDFFTKDVSTGEQNKIRFNDLNLKYEHNINRNNVFSINYLRSKDVFYYLFGSSEQFETNSKDISGVDWSNTALFLNYKHIGVSNTFTVFSGINNYEYNFINENYYYDKLENSYKKSTSIADLSNRIEFEYNISSKIKLTFGASYIYHNVKPLTVFIQKNKITESDENSNEIAGFAHLNYNITENDILSFGIRQSTYFKDTAYFPLEPRLSYIKKINKLWFLKSSVSRNVQFTHRIQNYSTGFPMEMWHVSNRNLKFENCYQISSELTRTIEKLKINIGASIYYKWMDNLTESVAYFSDFPLPTSLQNSLIEKNGKGQAYGFELFCNKQQGKLNYSFSYLLSNSIRRFDNINSNNWYPSNFDRRHYFNCNFSYNLNEKILFSLGWSFSTGQPVTIPEGKYYSPNNNAATIFYTGNINNFRLESYHRLDASVQFVKVKRKGTRIFEIGVYNLYNRANPFCINIVSDKSYVNNSWVETGKAKVIQYSLFPIVPSINFTWKFN